MTGYLQHASLQFPYTTLQRNLPSKEAKQLSGGKPTRVFIEYVPWGESAFDEEFIESPDPVLEDIEKNVDELREKWLSTLEKIVSAYQTDDLKKFFPQDTIHEECAYSHEGLVPPRHQP